MSDNTSPRWIAGLSNGETIVEGKGICIPDEKQSAWAKFQEHLTKNSLTVQSFGIWVGDRHFNLPSNSPRFDKFQAKGILPINYNCFRAEACDVLVPKEGAKAEEYICAEAIYKDFKLQVWVDILDTNKSWTNILKM